MIDIHSHIIYDIDDGCKNIEESIKALKELNSIGFSKIVLTPHYMEGSKYIANNTKKEEKIKVLKEKIKEYNIDIDLYLGNEIYISFDIEDLILKNEIHPIDNTKYLLIELSLYNEINKVEDYLYELKLKGYIPIIAHPERYLYFQKDYKKMDKLYESGVLFQSNYGSIIGAYGSDAKKLLKYALKKDMITFLATDIHRPNSSLIENFDKITKKIKKITGEEKFKKLSETNALKMLQNIEIEYE